MANPKTWIPDNKDFIISVLRNLELDVFILKDLLGILSNSSFTGMRLLEIPI